MMDMYDVARMATDEVLGDGTYAEINANHPDPGVQAAIRHNITKAVPREDDPTHCANCGQQIYPTQTARGTEHAHRDSKVLFCTMKPPTEVTFGDFMRMTTALFPNALISEESDGELLIHTGLHTVHDEGGNATVEVLDSPNRTGV